MNIYSKITSIHALKGSWIWSFCSFKNPVFGQDKHQEALNFDFVFLPVPIRIVF